MPAVALAVTLFLAGCAPPAPPANLKPVSGAFGYELAATIAAPVSDEVFTDAPPFRFLTVDTLADGRVCRITAAGFVDAPEFYDTKKRLLSVLSEKYGERPRELGDSAGIAQEIHFFGATNRAASLADSDYGSNAMFTVSYYDAALLAAYRAEQDAKDKADEQRKRAALSNGL